MAGKSGRTIAATENKPLTSRLLNWESMLVVLLVLVNIICIGISPVYNATKLLRESPKYLAEIFLLFPMAFILLLGEIDISVGSIVCLCATTAGMASNLKIPFVGVFLLTLLVGLACGAINGLLAVEFRELPTMIITLGTQIIYRGIAELMLGEGGSVSIKDFRGFKVLSTKVGPFPISFFLVVLTGIVFIIVASRMNYGRKLYAIGSNARTSFYSGIKVKRTIFIAYALMGLFSGLAALFLTAATYGANTTTGKGFEMDAIAMAVFGGVSTTGGKGKILGAFIAAFTILCLRVGLGQKNLNSQIILIIIGILLIVSVLIPNISGGFKARRKQA